MACIWCWDRPQNAARFLIALSALVGRILHFLGSVLIAGLEPKKGFWCRDPACIRFECRLSSIGILIGVVSLVIESNWGNTISVLTKIKKLQDSHKTVSFNHSCKIEILSLHQSGSLVHESHFQFVAILWSMRNVLHMLNPKRLENYFSITFVLLIAFEYRKHYFCGIGSLSTFIFKTSFWAGLCVLKMSKSSFENSFERIILFLFQFY